MAIADLLLRAVLGRDPVPSRLEFALSSSGVAIANTRTVVARGGWTFTAGTAATQVVFGPYSRPIRFDATPLSDGTDLLAPFPLTTVFELPAGMRFVRDVTITITADGP